MTAASLPLVASVDAVDDDSGLSNFREAIIFSTREVERFAGSAASMDPVRRSDNAFDERTPSGFLSELTRWLAAGVAIMTLLLSSIKDREELEPLCVWPSPSKSAP